jgi:hypothetical protein
VVWEEEVAAVDLMPWRRMSNLECEKRRAGRGVWRRKDAEEAARVRDAELQ